MRKIYIISLLLIMFLSVQNSYSQDCYTVIKVKGTVYNSSKGKDVAVNDELCTTHKLVFKSSNSVVVVHSTSKGRFTLKSQAKDKKSEFSCVISDILKQSTSGNLSSRGVTSLQEEFKDDYYIIGSLRIKVEDKDYPINENTFFYLRYNYKGDTINKKIPYSNDTLIFEKEQIYKYDGAEINSEDIDNVTLFYYDLIKKVSYKISTFKLTFLNEEEMYGELKSYRDLISNENKSNDDIYDEILSYVYDTYGNFNIEYFEQWYKTKFK